MNPCWLQPVTALSFRCFSATPRIIFSTFQAKQNIPAPFKAAVQNKAQHGGKTCIVMSKVPISLLKPPSSKEVTAAASQQSTKHTTLITSGQSETQQQIKNKKKPRTKSSHIMQVAQNSSRRFAAWKQLKPTITHTYLQQIHHILFTVSLFERKANQKQIKSKSSSKTQHTPCDLQQSSAF